MVLGWSYKLLSKKFEWIDKRFDKTDEKFDKIGANLKELRETLTAFEKNSEHRLTVLEMEAKNTNQRLSNIEGYLVPRKVYHIEEPHEEEPKEN